MEWFFIIVLGAVAYALWDRMRLLERRLGKLEERGDLVPVEAVEREVSRRLDAVDEEPREQPEPLSEPEPAIAATAPEPPSEIAAEPFEPEVSDEPAPSRFAPPKFDFEDIFGRRLPIWAGGIALAAGGIFLVIYAIEQGLMGPTTRVAMSFIFGLMLLGAAEAAHRFDTLVADPRVRQALAGAGLATLYAAFYLAGSQYGLIGPGVAFAGLALVTGVALGLTFRFGLPTAVLGLVGGFATPVLVASDEANVPVLTFYLALLTAGLAVTARRLGHRWLGFAALAIGFLWGGTLLFAMPADNADIVAIGLYVLVLGAAIPVVIGEDERLPVARIAAGSIAAIQLAVLVSLAGFDLLTWGLYLLLAAALAVLSWREASLRPANALVLAVGVALLILWPDPEAGEFVVVAGALAGISLGLPLAALWRDRGGLLELAQVSLGALALGWASSVHFGNPDNEVFNPALAAAFAALALATGAGAWRAWQDVALGRLLALPVAATAILAFAATHVLLPDWIEVFGAAAVTLVLVELTRRRRRKSLAGVAWGGAVVTLLALLTTGDIWNELEMLVEEGQRDSDTLRAIIRWALAASPFAALAFVEWRRRAKRTAEAVLAFLAYGLLAQIVPGTFLAWIAALAAMTTLWWQRERTGFWGAMMVFAALWSVVPLAEWIDHGAKALGGIPMLADGLPSPRRALRTVLPLALASGFACWRMADRPVVWRGMAMLAGVSGLVVLHVLFKQLFALGSEGDFVALGMAERTVWQALLVASGIALAHWHPAPPERWFGNALVAIGLLHFALFTFSLHNPLWSEQAVGPLPLANWLLPAYAIAGAAIWWQVGQAKDVVRGKVRRIGDALLMLLIAFWALSELRHAFSGTILTATDLTQTEDLLRSLLGIVLALGFLWWGSRTGQRSWRIGSLVLMVLAVAKVFLFDAAGLEGLLRIASFIALGFSLIGIGMFYARVLTAREVS